MTNPFKTVSIFPDTVSGFTFTWTMLQQFADAKPWSFYIQYGLAIDGPWTSVNSSPVLNQFLLNSSYLGLISKDRELFFRVKLITSAGTYYSHTVSPYANMNRREWLMMKDIMRRELLHMRKGAGVEGYLWSRNTFGTKCSHCLDPITGDQTCGDSCEYCQGTGREPGYLGPYDMWFIFTADQHNPEMSPDGTGTRQDYKYQVRCIGVPPIKGEDVIIDKVSGKHYHVESADSAAEWRRFRVIQSLLVKELSASSPINKLRTTPPDVPAVPVWPSGAILTATDITNTTVALSWPAATSATGYKLYKDNVLYATQAGRTITVTGLTAETVYSFKIEAYNTAGTTGDGPAITIKSGNYMVYTFNTNLAAGVDHADIDISELGLSNDPDAVAVTVIGIAGEPSILVGKVDKTPTTVTVYFTSTTTTTHYSIDLLVTVAEA